MNDLTIKLSIKTMSKGLLYLYDESDEREIEIEVELEFEYDPEEKQTMESPRVHEELRLTGVKAPFGDIEIDSIQNLDEFDVAALECMNREGLEP